MSARCVLWVAQIGPVFKGAGREEGRHGHCNVPGVNKPLAILHANCQGEPLAAMLRTSPDFGPAFEPRVYLNYARQPIPQEDLDRCGLFLYQYLGPDWGGLASEALLARLPAGCPSLCIPNMFFRGPWPLWSGAPGFDYRDELLDRLIDSGLPAQEVLRLYLTMPLEKKYDLDGRLRETVKIEQARQARTPVKYLDHVLEHWRSRPLFHTVNHPGAELLLLAARGIADRLGLAPPDGDKAPAPGGIYADCDLPVHPQVAAHYGLKWAGPKTAFNVYGRRRTFTEYAVSYVACRQAGVADFIAFLSAGREHGGA